MMIPSRSRAFASLLAMAFLVLGAVLATFLYATMSSAVSIGRNQDMSKQAALAAESGLDYLNVMLPQISSTNTIIATTRDGMLAGLQQLLHDQPNLLSGSPAISSTGAGNITIGPITTATQPGATWTFGTMIQSIPTTFDDLTKDDLKKPLFRVTVTGRYTRGSVKATRIIGMEAKAVSMAHPPAGACPIVVGGHHRPPFQPQERWRVPL